MAEITRDDIFAWLAQVKDPEIPVLSLIDLGVIRAVAVGDNGRVTIVMTPTFVGCPALDMMKSEIREVLLKNGIAQVDIKITYKEPWTSDMISEKGRVALRQFGLSPPPSRQIFEDLNVMEHAVCPRCGHTNTDLKNPFGATLCRSVHYCNDCKEAFEQFKPL